MTHFGIISPSSTGHLNTMLPLGRKLQERGHRVTLFGIPSSESKILAIGLGFQVIGESEFSLERAAQLYAKLGTLSGQAALQHMIYMKTEFATAVLRDVPIAAKKLGVEAFLVDQVELEGGTVAEFLNLPFITICSAVIVNQDDTVPPFVTPWNYNPAFWARLRNRIGYSMFNRTVQPIQKLISEYRRQWNLPPYSGFNDCFSRLAIISQQPLELEFPRTDLPQYFHFTGPFHDSTGRQHVDFPFEKLNGKPLIYASMGTLQNRQHYIFECIAEACVGLDAQLVISLGGALKPEALPKLPGEPLVVGYAPQLEIIKKATLTITHAGLNTTLESLSNGVPMVAIPLTNDQPGVAARLARAGAGEMVPVSRLNASRLRTAIQQVLTQDSYKNNAVRLQQAIRQAGGVSRAVNIIEQATSTARPVMVA